MSASKPAGGHRQAVAATYIIALNADDAGSFVICQPTLVIDKGDHWGGLTSDEIAQYIKRNMLPAAPLPGRPLHSVEFTSGPAGR